jgi:peptidoglycan/LPS O-acetylase OafA/YrhL
MALTTEPVPTASSGTARPRLGYLPGLDGMRALAVVAVMVYHANPDWLPGGFLGVEVFFVISGYLITLLLLVEFDASGRIALGRFWSRRARRLLPALFVLLFLVLVVTALFRADTMGRVRGDLVAGFAYVSNWYQIWTAQGYAAAGDFAPLRHLWSLAVEEQFYLVWPLVMVALLRRRDRWTPALVAAWLFTIAVLVTIVVAVLHHSGRIADCAATPEAYWVLGDRCLPRADALYLSTITRSSGLLLGAALAFMWRPEALARGPIRRNGGLLDLIGVVGLATLAVLAWRLHFMTPDGADDVLFRGGFLFTDIATLVVIAAVTHPAARLGTALGIVPLRWIGTRSYGLYLYHWPIYQLIRKVAGNRLTFGEFVVATVLTVLIAEASYQFLERPIRTGEMRFWLRRIWYQDDQSARLVLGTATVVCLALGTVSVVRMQHADSTVNAIEAALEEGRGDTVTVDDLLTGVAVAAPRERLTPVTDAPTVPATTVPATVPSTVPLTTVPATTVPPTVPATTAAPVVAATPTVPATTVPSTVLLTTVPATTVPPTVPATTVPPTAPATTVPVAPAPIETAAPGSTLPPVPTRVARLAIGDSVMLGAAGALADRGWVVNAEVSRQMIDTIPLMQQLGGAGVFGDVVMIHLGTNGPISNASLDGVLAPLAGVPRVVLLTIRADRSWTNGNNDLIRARAGGNITVVDWAARSNDCPGDCFEDDDIHLRPEGRVFYADLVTAAVG